MPSFTCEGGLTSTIVTLYVTRLLTTVDVPETDVTLPATSVLGSAGNVTVAGWPTAIFVASASAKPATISSLSRVASVTKEEELDEEAVEVDAAAPVAAPPPEELDGLVAP